MIRTDKAPTAATVAKLTGGVFEHAARATRELRAAWNPAQGTPVYTVEGRYTTRGWTEWTQGFMFGNAVYLFDATGDKEMLEYGRAGTVDYMASHVSHIGVHDHGFNNVSTYGNLLRLMAEGRLPFNAWEAKFYRVALKVSGAVQAARWTEIAGGLGYVHSFNGPHSLFSDTIRSMRALAVAHQLGHVLMGEQDRKISLLERALVHAEATSRFNVYFGTGRDSYDLRGRVVHESIFNTNNGVYRCPSTQQGYTPFSTWTRGLAWILAGYPEQLEWLRTRTDAEIAAAAGAVFGPGATGAAGTAGAGGTGSESAAAVARAVERRFLETACAVADFFLEYTPTDGIPYWDTGAPGLVHLGDYLNRPADPYNEHEPVDSSAAAIGAQGLLRLGRYLVEHADRLIKEGVVARTDNWPQAPGDTGAVRALGERYTAAALVAAQTLFQPPYLSTKTGHQGILLHAVYHRPNGWDHMPGGSTVPSGESCLWGDYHLLELAVYLKRLTEGSRYLTFFDIDTAEAAR